MAPRYRLRLLSASLHYPPELIVHTAASGAIDHLAALFLVIDSSDGFQGIGEVRANISYLTNLAEDRVAPAIIALCQSLPWSLSPDGLLQVLPTLAAQSPNIARAAVENALVEGLARGAGMPVARWLGGAWQERTATNQCLFWGPDDRFDRLAGRYVAEGFRDLKVRIAVGSFDHDLARLQRLRARFGDTIRIAVDANGAWSGEQARRCLAALAPLGLSYVEQPTPAGDWAAFSAALHDSPISLMLDESLAGPDDITRLASFGPGALAHLKVVKLGGPLAVMQAANSLAAAGIGVMVGQMNEGALATALTAQCAMAIRPAHAELYGCYGLLDDATSGLSYLDGAVRVDDAPGLGVSVDLARCAVLWEETLG